VNAFLPFIVIGLVVGSVYGLAGLGLVLTYKTSGIFNIGYGAVACGAAFIFYALWGQHGWPWPWAALVTLGVFAPIAGCGLEMVARSLDGASETLKVVSTVGLILIVGAIASLWFPQNPPTFNHFLSQGTVKILGVFITWEQIIIFVFAIAASGLLYWFFRSVRSGILMRGIVDSHELVSMAGDSPSRVRRSAWIIGTMFASIAGLFLAPALPLDGVSLTTLVFGAFGAAAIGFFSNMPLTFAGGLLIGIAGSFMDKYAGSFSWMSGLPPSLPFIVLFVVLIVTPRARLVSRRIAPQLRARATYHAPVRVRLGAGAIAIVLLALVPALQSHYLALWSSALVNMILFLSLGLLVRNSGQISLCHLAFAAVGAAAFGHFTSSFGLPWLLSFILAALVAVPVGAIVAIPAVRVSGVYLALATLGFALLIQDVFYNTNLMFGQNSVGLAEPRPDVSIGGWHLASDQGFYFLLLLIAVLVVASVAVITRGRLGRLLKGLSDSQVALETRGTTASVLKVIVFCVTAAMASMAGALSGMLFHYGVPGSYQAFGGLQLVVLVVIVQIGDPWYAVIGAVLTTVLPGYINAGNFTSYLNLLFGISALIIAINVKLAPGTPLKVQAFLDRLGGRRPVPSAQALESAPVETGKPVEAPVLVRADSGRSGLAVRELSVTYGGVKAVDRASLNAPMGRITGLIGPNGAGKTSLFNACSGLVDAASGHVLLHDTDITRGGPAYRARQGLGRTFQRPELFNSLTVRQNVAFGCEGPMAGANPLTQFFDSRAGSKRISAATDEALALTGIEGISDQQVGLLSIGKRRLVDLAIVLAGPFDVLLLDEPSSGLDHHETETFGQVLSMVVETKGVGILLVEHDMTLVRAVCEHIFVLDFGSMIFEGSPEEMQASAAVRAAYLGETSLDEDAATDEELSPRPIGTPAVSAE
jgi:ABC-type branched-subunit amino acid transport system ATPase component/branched-subunit amino acid ABC-type transport system permease component